MSMTFVSQRIVLLSALLPVLAPAANITFTAATGNYNAGANWGGGVVPGTGDTAFIHSSRVATHSAGVTTTDSVRLGANNGVSSGGGAMGTGTLEVTGGTLEFNAGDPYRDSSGTINVNGGTLLQTGGNTRMAHRNGSVDTVNVTAGTLTNTSRTSGENGAWSLNVSGGTAEYVGSHFDAAVNPDAGDTDPDTFAINQSGGTLRFGTTNPVRPAGRAGSNSTITQTGGTLVTDATTRIDLATAATGTVVWDVSGMSVINIGDDLNSGVGIATFNVIGSDPLITVADDFNFSSAASTVSFVMDAAGVSTINAADVLFSNGPALEVVVNNGLVTPGPLGFGGTGSVDLFSYSGSQSGTFGSESIQYNGRLLTLDADPSGNAAALAPDSYFLDYDNAGNVSLLFHVVPEPSRALLLGFAGALLALRRRR